MRTKWHITYVFIIPLVANGSNPKRKGWLLIYKQISRKNSHLPSCKAADQCRDNLRLLMLIEINNCWQQSKLQSATILYSGGQGFILSSLYSQLTKENRILILSSRIHNNTKSKHLHPKKLFQYFFCLDVVYIYFILNRDFCCMFAQLAVTEAYFLIWQLLFLWFEIAQNVKCRILFGFPL